MRSNVFTYSVKTQSILWKWLKYFQKKATTVSDQKCISISSVMGSLHKAICNMEAHCSNLGVQTHDSFHELWKNYAKIIVEKLWKKLQQFCKNLFEVCLSLRSCLNSSICSVWKWYIFWEMPTTSLPGAGLILLFLFYLFLYATHR